MSEVVATADLADYLVVLDQSPQVQQLHRGVGKLAVAFGGNVVEGSGGCNVAMTLLATAGEDPLS